MILAPVPKEGFSLLLIEGSHQRWYVVAPFALLTAALGVFLAIPMKRQMVNQEQLKFPSGIAAAETLRSLYSKGAEAMKKAWALLISLAAGGLVAADAGDVTRRAAAATGLIRGLMAVTTRSPHRRFRAHQSRSGKR